MKRIVVLIALTMTACQLEGCGARPPKPTEPEEDTAAKKKIAKAKDVRFVEDDELEGLRMILREAGSTADEVDAAALPEAEILSKKRTDQLLARVEALKTEADDRKAFALRKSSDPPPRPGKELKVEFPPKKSPPRPDQGKPGVLEVLRFAPEGDVPLAPHLSVTFSKPMVAVTSQEEAAETVPAKLDPTPAGDWRWLGTRTLMFKPDVRFPMATDYEVKIPAGTESATGLKLKKSTRFSFSTPALGVETKQPTRGPHDLTPVIFIEFDQRIDTEALLPYIELEHDREPVPIRLATADEIAVDDTARTLSERAEKGRWIALKAERKLKKDTHFTVRVRKGAPSAEGPKKTPGDQPFTFYTYAPLRIVRKRCGWSDECPPTAEWRIEFNNPLDDDEFDPDAITIEPRVPGADIRQWGDTITISGMKQGRTRYTVKIPRDLKDKFGQRLGKTEHLVFEVGPAEKTLFGPGKQLLILDPTGPAKLPVHTINHKHLKVRVHRVKPELWDKWIAWMQKYRYDTDKPGPMPGKRVFDKKIKVKGERDRLTQTMIDLKPHLKKGYGQFAVRIEPSPQPKERWNRQEVLVWVQVTDIGLTAFVDYEEMIAWATKLEDGKALGGVELELLPGGSGSESDNKGLARIELPGDAEQARVLVGRKGADVAMLPQDTGWWYGGGWNKVERNDQMRWYTFDDRGMYRPDEEVRVKGWIRKFEPKKNGDIRALEKRPSKISWNLRGPRGNDLLKGSVKVSALGGFDVAFKLPKDVNLGTAWLELSAAGAGAISNTSHTHSIKIQEFRRPEFEVSASAEPGPHLLGQEAIVTVDAAYYAGGGLPGAPVTWRAYASPGSYVPPDREEFQFGPWQPWWRSFSSGGGGSTTEMLEGKTDALGQHHLGIHFEAVNPARPMSVRAEATVVDVNRQAWTAKKELLVHPSSLYVGLKTERGFVKKDDPIDVEALVVDIDGKVKTEVDVALKMARLKSSWKKGKWQEEEVDPVERKITSAAEAKQVRFLPEIGGSYKITATIRDSLGRKNVTELRIWVAGGEQPPSRDVEQEKLTLVPEREEYQPGETARILLQSPFHPAEGVLTVRRSGLVRKERFSLTGPSKELAVKILESHIPDVTVQIDLVGSAGRTDDKGRPRDDLPRRVAYAKGSLTFKVPPLARTLDVAAKPRLKALEPGGKTTIDLVVKDAEGRAVSGAELAVVVADESVLALSGYKLPDPIELFYSARGPQVWDYHSRSQVLLADPEELGKLVAAGGGGPGLGNMAVQSAMPMGGAMLKPAAAPRASRGLEMDGEVAADMALAEAEPPEEGRAYKMKKKSEKKADKGGYGGEDRAPIAVRTDFRALALFAPEVKTDARGKAAVPLTLPDSLTRYRVMVVAVQGGQSFGTGEANLTARLPLMVRPSAPRFLNFGDRFELPVVLQNQTDAPMTVEVAVRGSNISLADTLAKAKPGRRSKGPAKAGRKVAVPANDRVEVRFPAAAQMAGTARFQVVASGDGSADAADFDLPVWTPATSEAFATYGEIDKGSLAQPVRTPGDVWPQFGGLTVTTSSTQLQALTDAVLYLVSYPFDCNEQIASRIIAIAALRDVLDAFEAEGLPEPKELKESIKRDLKRLKVRQNHDGGFSFWRKGERSWPYLSIHAANAMARAKIKGYKVPEQMWTRSLRHLDRIERYIPHWYSKESKWTLRAYALYVRRLMGDVDAPEAKRLLKEAGVKDLPLEAHGWILPVLHAGKAKDETARVIRHLGNRIAETAAGAHFVTGYSDGAHVLLHSDRRVDGVILESLIEVEPKSDLITKLVRGLLGHRKKGRWLNTQENAFVLLALDRYFNVFEKVTPDFVARVWLGEGFAGEHKFKGRTTERAHIDIPMSWLAERKGDQSLLLQKDGKGRLYYRIGMRYAPRDLTLEPADYGFALERAYESVDDEGDVKRDKNGTWRFKAGARVRVRLTMAVPMRRYHVALVDPLPAGLEPINPELAVSGTIPEDPDEGKKGGSRYWWWWRPWYEHQNMRDERVEAFSSLLWDGVHEYTYVARATTPGVFVVPPTRAEEMYHPETFGRTGSAKVVVE
jgi:uncharacterized protein YfaS (alpha-2-macroglobulin family)